MNNGTSKQWKTFQFIKQKETNELNIRKMEASEFNVMKCKRQNIYKDVISTLTLSKSTKLDSNWKAVSIKPCIQHFQKKILWGNTTQEGKKIKLSVTFFLPLSAYTAVISSVTSILVTVFFTGIGSTFTLSPSVAVSLRSRRADNRPSSL